MKLIKTLARTLAAATLSAGVAASAAGMPENHDRRVEIHGSVQADGIVPSRSEPQTYKERVLGNVYADAGLFSKFIDAGLRVEFLEHPMPVFQNVAGFKGWGLGNFYVTGKYKGFQLTAGDIYEQFGSGLILRTYEDRALGIDNAIRGGRLRIDALRGFHFTVLSGVQRRYWDWTSQSRVYGAEAVWKIQEHIPALARRGIVWTLGASWTTKRERYSEKTDSIMVPLPDVGPDGSVSFKNLNLPQRVNAFDLTTRFEKDNVGLLAEIAWKHPDPTADNNYTFSRGTALLLGADYANKRGVNVEVTARRSEDMAFRSRRTMTDITSFINYLPPLTYQHTYSLAQVYPYATAYAPGEWAFQVTAAFNIKSNTRLHFNFSNISGLKRDEPWQKVDDRMFGKNGVPTSFFGMGELYYRDLSLRLAHKSGTGMQLDVMYIYQFYNKTAAEGAGGNVNAHIAAVECKQKCSDKMSLRAQVQYLATRQDKGDRIYGLVELSVLPLLTFGASDEWNLGNPDGDKKHFYMFNITCRYRNNRFMLGYGRTREGFINSGGVSRFVPETRGLFLAYNFNF